MGFFYVCVKENEPDMIVAEGSCGQNFVQKNLKNALI